jgi:phage tail-like protein
MAVECDRPYGSFHFRVAIGERAKASRGFSQVVLPDLLTRRDTPVEILLHTESQRTLLLRRGFAGTLELYDWWNKARRSKRTRARTVTVELLDEPCGKPVVTWIFTGCRPVRLIYSALDAQTSGLLFETIELSFDDIAIA